MKRSAPVFILLALFSASIIVGQLSILPASAKENWTGVRSKNFSLVGNASEGDIRKVAVKLEQFRHVFSLIFRKANLSSSVPTTVIVFKNKSSYRPFMPAYQGKINEVAGYFQPGSDINYITMTAEMTGETPYGTIFHEYVHALTNDNTFHAPPWFGEGLAEFYSSFEVTDGDKKVWLGKPISHHVFLLRENKFVPLARLFAVDHGSPEYNERDKKGVFYAESWALIHYLMLGNNGKRQKQFIEYLSLLANKTPVGEAFEKAFQTDFATMEKELREYINRNSYPVQIFTFDQKLQFDTGIQSAPISEAESQYHLGDLLLHSNRAEAEDYLQKAISLDPNLALAHASMGMVRMRQQKFDEAKKHLQQAATLGSQNHMVHYYYAFVLSREGMDGANRISEYPAEAADKMREHLKQAIAIAPAFVESYRLLAFVNMVIGEHLDESEAMLKQAMAIAPGKEELVFMLAQLYMRRQDYEAARKTAEPLAASSANPQMRAQATSLVETIKSITDRLAQFKAETGPGNVKQVVTREGPKTDEGKPRIVLRRRPEGEKARGLLTEVQCNDKGMTVLVKDGDRIVRFNTTTPERIQFITYTQQVSDSITCGKVNPPKQVVVTYRGSTDARSPFDGELIAVEFVPQEQK